mmetsp:Transcript_10461/g.15672  ORF Transcript_10461/g.15672 Transcript_10461/m.15672 type:complete len:85 (+) Transcript_10461:1734-1988(+)
MIIIKSFPASHAISLQLSLFKSIPRPISAIPKRPRSATTVPSRSVKRERSPRPPPSIPISRSRTRKSSPTTVTSAPAARAIIAP